MDPDQALRQIRALVEAALEGGRIDPVELAELVEGLDNWISRGGFLPEAWRPVDNPISGGGLGLGLAAAGAAALLTAAALPRKKG